MDTLLDLHESRTRTEWLLHDLADDVLRVPEVRIVNLPLWELGHVAWFQEQWLLRRLDARASLHPRGDRLYDSARIGHAERWRLELPSRAETQSYVRQVLEAVDARLSVLDATERSLEDYFVRLATYHEDMHGEAFFYTRQTLGWPAPKIASPSPGAIAASSSLRDALVAPSALRDALVAPSALRDALVAPSALRDAVVVPSTPHDGHGQLPGDVDVPGGLFELGGTRSEPFVFDNEKWAHARRVEPFRIARAPVTQAEFAAFVDAGGYRRDAWWSEAGRRWRDATRAERPLHWRRDGARGWWRVHFDTPVPLEPDRPMLHVSWYEAEAFCAYAGRRLPTELEWEVAAAGVPDGRGGLAATKRRFPWGDEPPTRAHAHLAHDAHGAPDRTCDVAAFARGDSAWGCRQMIGNVWEWTADDFGPYPGFVRDPYAEYSEPWFGDHKVLRGGAFTTRPRLLRNSWRNFYTPDRRDVMAGFRTCAVDRPRA